MKKLLSIIVAAVLCTVLFPNIADASSAPALLYVNGVKQEQTVSPVVTGKQVYLPADTLARLLQAALTWNDQRNAVNILGKGMELSFKADDDQALINGKAVNLQKETAYTYQNSLMIPLRYTSNALGIKYTWDKYTNSLHLYMRDAGSGTGGSTPPGNVSPPNSSLPSNELVTISVNDVYIKTNRAAQPNYFSLYEASPYRIVLDYPKAAFSDEAGKLDEARLKGELTAASSSSSIQKVRYAIHNKDTVRFVVELSRAASYTVTQSADKLRTTVSTGANHNNQSIFTIVIDAGHGGKDPGAPGFSGRAEKHFTLELSQKIAEQIMLEPELRVFMTRWDDTFIELADRATLSNQIDADLYISIHGNTFNQQISGTETYYYGSSSASFATIMHKHMLAATKLPDRRVREENFQVLRLTEAPAVLLEIGYLSNPAEEATMLSAQFQDQVASAIVAAIKEYLQL